MELICPYGCQDLEGQSSIYRWEDGSFKCAVCKVRFQIIQQSEKEMIQ